MTNQSRNQWVNKSINGSISLSKQYRPVWFYVGQSDIMDLSVSIQLFEWVINYLQTVALSIWFFFFFFWNDISTFVCYLMLNLSFYKNSSDTIWSTAGGIKVVMPFLAVLIWKRTKKHE